jgi:adenine-specific DNA-methyltransferase
MPTLDWLDREHAMRRADGVPYRLLEHVSTHGDPNAGNLLIQGDNLEALKALLPLYRGRVRCIFIDPPYNTKTAFEHYADSLEHSQWLSMMVPRLTLLRELLADVGSIWVTIDDNEAHYLKILMDEIFGRRNFVANVLWQKRTSPDARIHLGAAHDHLLVYGRQAERILLRKLKLSDEQAKAYKNPDNDDRGAWVSTDFTAQGWRPNQMYKITTPNGTVYDPPPGRCWGNVEKEFLLLRGQGRIWFGKNGDARPRVKNYISEHEGISSWTWWANEDVGHNQESKKEINELFGAGDAFDTPKPERLIQRILEIATDDDDIVLDSFLGSGTTAAVAHKMGRRYVGIEMSENSTRFCEPRLRKVIEGEQGGISQVIGWKGGGGFQFLRLGEAVFDELGAINPKVRFATLANFIWLQETGLAASQRFKSPLLGVHEETAYYLLFNGILGDKRPDGGNVLTGAVLQTLMKKHKHDGLKVIYGEGCRLGDARLEAAGVAFKHIPYDVKAR